MNSALDLNGLAHSHMKRPKYPYVS